MTGVADFARLVPKLQQKSSKALRALWFLIGHDLFGKPLHTFPDHAQGGQRAQRACRFRRHGRGRVRQAGGRGCCRADGSAGRATRFPDGFGHAPPRDRCRRKHQPGARRPLRRDFRRDACAYAARGGDRGNRAGAQRQCRHHRHDRRRLDHRRRESRAALPRQRHQQRRGDGRHPRRQGRSRRR